MTSLVAGVSIKQTQRTEECEPGVGAAEMEHY